MIGKPTGRPLVAALFAGMILISAPLRAQDALVVETSAGVVLGRLAFAEGREICLSWAHSVTGGAVVDCFENRDGTMLLTRSYLHDFAAGLGEVAGRGKLRPAAGGGYWIEAMDEAIPGNALTLRIGAPRVNHVLTGADEALHLSALAPGARVSLRLVSHPVADSP